MPQQHSAHGARPTRTFQENQVAISDGGIVAPRDTWRAFHGICNQPVFVTVGSGMHQYRRMPEGEQGTALRRRDDCVPLFSNERWRSNVRPRRRSARRLGGESIRAAAHGIPVFAMLNSARASPDRSRSWGLQKTRSWGPIGSRHGRIGRSVHIGWTSMRAHLPPEHEVRYHQSRLSCAGAHLSGTRWAYLATDARARRATAGR